jgi:hypothetical protein
MSKIYVTERLKKINAATAEKKAKEQAVVTEFHELIGSFDEMVGELVGFDRAVLEELVALFLKDEFEVFGVLVETLIVERGVYVGSNLLTFRLLLPKRDLVDSTNREHYRVNYEILPIPPFVA